MCVSEEREGNSTEELEIELEALDITDDPLDLDTADETESEELAKKLLDEQGTHNTHTNRTIHNTLTKNLPMYICFVLCVLFCFIWLLI